MSGLEMAAPIVTPVVRMIEFVRKVPKGM